jgi:hypothetical protein
MLLGLKLFLNHELLGVEPLLKDFSPYAVFFIFPSSVAVGKFHLYTAIEGVAS